VSGVPAVCASEVCQAGQSDGKTETRAGCWWRGTVVGGGPGRAARADAGAGRARGRRRAAARHARCAHAGVLAPAGRAAATDSVWQHWLQMAEAQIAFGARFGQVVVAQAGRGPARPHGRVCICSCMTLHARTAVCASCRAFWWTAAAPDGGCMRAAAWRSGAPSGASSRPWSPPAPG
jgi:hypothetical protein